MRWHLFANGGFNILYQGSIVESWCCYKGVPHWWNHAKGSQGAFDKFRGEYFLIARPISDMTDQELRNIYKNPNIPEDEIKEWLTIMANNGTIRLDIVGELSDRGVYFGPQSHFDDGTVIDGSKLEEA